MADSHRKALDAPTGDLALIDDALIDRAVAYSRTSPRKRVIQPFHAGEHETLHRMLNAAQPESYIPPHRHLDPPKTEAWIILRGSLGFFTFEDDGTIRDCVRLGLPGDPVGVDLAPGVYHTFVALEPDTVIFEVKTGPYHPANDKTFAPWAPAEGDPDADAYRLRLLAELARRVT